LLLFSLELATMSTFKTLKIHETLTFRVYYGCETCSLLFRRTQVTAKKMLMKVLETKKNY
jgi:hypothetical protein